MCSQIIAEPPQIALAVCAKRRGKLCQKPELMLGPVFFKKTPPFWMLRPFDRRAGRNTQTRMGCCQREIVPIYGFKVEGKTGKSVKISQSPPAHLSKGPSVLFPGPRSRIIKTYQNMSVRFGHESGAVRRAMPPARGGCLPGVIHEGEKPGLVPSFRRETRCWWGRAVPTPVHELALALCSNRFFYGQIRQNALEWQNYYHYPTKSALAWPKSC